PRRLLIYFHSFNLGSGMGRKLKERITLRTYRFPELSFLPERSTEQSFSVCTWLPLNRGQLSKVYFHGRILSAPVI
ncbi:hypothetical protein, partial [Escherichia coli]|uniref:hypothetical protein n=1 Tax=Escherichia coli TaxID=562 RepID=UPI001BB47EED